MEIERKWMVNGWPEGLALKEEFAMRQGYISVRPTVRIREEALTGGKTHYVLCFKSAAGWRGKRSSGTSTLNFSMISRRRSSAGPSSRSSAAATCCRTVRCWK